MPRVVILASKVAAPVFVRHAADGAFAPRSARPQPGQGRRRGRLIQEDEALWGDGGERIAATPAASPRHAQWRSGTFFERQPEPRQRPRHGGGTDGHPLGGGPVRTVLGQRGSAGPARAVPRRQHRSPLPPSSRPRGHVPRLPPALLPAADRPIGDAKGAGRPPLVPARRPGPAASGRESRPGTASSAQDRTTDDSCATRSSSTPDISPSTAAWSLPRAALIPTRPTRTRSDGSIRSFRSSSTPSTILAPVYRPGSAGIYSSRCPS